jgi:hypothetical protein
MFKMERSTAGGCGIASALDSVVWVLEQSCEPETGAAAGRMSAGSEIGMVAGTFSSVNPDRPHASGEGETAVLDEGGDRETGEGGRSGTGRTAEGEEKKEKEEERGLRT